MGRQRSLEVIQQAEWVTIGELVRLTNVLYSTMKFYTEEGMIPFEQAEENLTRRYRRTEAFQRIEDPAAAVSRTFDSGNCGNLKG
ncbi:MAG: MerR family transcriptional regulator [Holdemania massiliensis]